MLYVVESVIEQGYWRNRYPRDHPQWRADWQRAGEYTTRSAIRAPNRYIAWLAARARHNYARMISQIVRPAAESDYREFEVREGDGNMGCYRLGTVRAIDMGHAVRLARRAYLHVPVGCESGGDDITAYICKYSSRMDYCPYVAEVIDLDGIAKRI